MGIKPLYWTRVGDRLLFGSEIKAHSRERAGRRRSQRPRRSPSCSARDTSSGAETLFRGIHRLLPGHVLVFEDGAVTTPAVLGRPRSDGDPELGALSDSATVVERSASGSKMRSASRLMGDVPLGHVPLRRPRQQRDRRADGAA